MNPRAKLRRVIKSSGKSIRGYAKEHRLSAPLLSMWISGDRTPGLPNAIRLEELTGIPHAAWVSRRRRPAPAAAATP